MRLTSGRSVATALLAAALATSIAACNGAGGGSDVATSVAPSVDASAVAWAEASTCPTSATGLKLMSYGGGFANARPGTDQHLMPAGDVRAVMRCDTDSSADGSDGVTKTMLVDPQPVSWFATGDHFPTAFRPLLNGRTGYAVVVHYAFGPEAVVSTWESTDGARVSDNGVIRCTTRMPASNGSRPAETECKPHGGGPAFVPASTRVAAGAPPVDCAPPTGRVVPTPAASPRTGTAEHIAPAAGVVVVALCSSVGGQAEFWGDAARAVVEDDDQPFTVGYPGACVQFEPNCNGLRVDSFVGYTNGPPVDVTAWLTADVAPSVGPLAPPRDPATYGGAVTNGVIGCLAEVERGIDPGFDPTPPPIRACFPFTQVTSVASPWPTTTVTAAP